MFPKHDFDQPACDAEGMAAMRHELREIARELRAISAGLQPRMPNLLADQIRAQIGRIQHAA